MKGLMIFTNYFEDVEGIATVDVLRRGGVELTCVSLRKENYVLTSSNNKIIFDKSLNEVNYKEYDFLIIPGGKAVFKELRDDFRVSEVVKHFFENNKLMCSICAGPSVIGKHGYFKGEKYTCFPGCDDIITEGERVDEPVVVSNNFITARSMYYTNDFAIEILRKVKGDSVAEEVKKQIKGL